MLALTLLFSSLQVLAAPAPGAAESKPLVYSIIVTGDELLEGVYADAHTFFLTRTLRPLGGRCVGSMSVDDNEADLKQALRFAAARAPVVIVTGGLGPTTNDITRETLASFTGVPLAEHPAVLADLEQRFRQNRDQLRPNLRRQALIPTRGTYLKNPGGTAAGLVFDCGESVIVALPGPPRELQPMVTNELVPFLQQRFKVRPWGCSVTLRFVGAGQSLIDQAIHDHVPLFPDVTVSSQFEGGRVDFTFALPGNTAADHARLDQLKEKIREHLGAYLYSEDGSSLEDQVVKLLAQRSGSLVLAEAGSGGQLAAGLNGARNSARLLAGSFVAPTEDQLARLLQIPTQRWADLKTGAEKAQCLAAMAAKMTRSEWAVAVGQAQTEDKGGAAVWVAFQAPGNPWEPRRLALRDLGELGRTTLATQILDLLRKQIQALKPASP